MDIFAPDGESAVSAGPACRRIDQIGSRSTVWQPALSKRSLGRFHDDIRARTCSGHGRRNVVRRHVPEAMRVVVTELAVDELSRKDPPFIAHRETTTRC